MKFAEPYAILVREDGGFDVIVRQSPWCWERYACRLELADAKNICALLNKEEADGEDAD